MGHSANMTLNNFSPYALQVAVVHRHCIYPQTGHDGTGIDAFNTTLAASGGTFSGKIENKNNSSGGDLCATDTGYFELSFTVLRGEAPDPRYAPSCVTIAIPHAHFQRGEGSSDRAVVLDAKFTDGSPDTITIDIRDNA